ncbi:hypothetical protein LTR91_007605 [Friedmanniomyces endolithicus]|uniref:CipC-like antibiotic response protein n=1 Tax=Friedmanniomyces endolithicus TaxID=329885 RepID=A0AAN6QVD4_9PEZI|nr:hypothetical protein LTR94_003137 [Friedmanniomyces endolithicus]KAK0813804.1 hypothetical protein LTR59_000959 [Friedmanniomyces endolithicus]KAK0814762.1 hypothetical protein LTR38_002592 [Friedmanniomyces endolithicus]KAK0815038.1 hypothetical protein LTR75_004039 [Friedmanniomyces endolithicus]KAK0851990.1 hypothetical protein LTR03_003735 [Friedmanniomyces endolithicus]
MFGFGEGQQQYDQVYNQDQGDQNDDQNQGKFSHELIAGGASFAAMKVFEDRQRAEGKTVDHQFAKEMLAGIAGGEVDKLCETKGADYIDRERAKRQASENTSQMYDQHYGQQDQYDPNQYGPPQQLRDTFGGGNNW